MAHKKHRTRKKELAPHSGRNTEKSLLIQEGKSIDLKIEIHNINGLKQSTQKLDNLLEWVTEENFGIVGLVETNITEKEGSFAIGKGYSFRGFWSKKESIKRKGSGVGILVRNDWEKHLGRLVRRNEYIIEANFYFRQLEIVVIVVYIPPNDKEVCRNIQQEIVKRYLNRSNFSQFIIMGDFNHVTDLYMDREGSGENKNSKILPLHRWLRSQDFQDTFRFLHPNTRGFSWCNNTSKSRIDQI